MGKIVAGQVNLGFIELPCELARCRKLQRASNEEMETLRKKEAFCRNSRIYPLPDN